MNNTFITSSLQNYLVIFFFTTDHSAFNNHKKCFKYEQ